MFENFTLIKCIIFPTLYVFLKYNFFPTPNLSNVARIVFVFVNILSISEVSKKIYYCRATKGEKYKK